MGMYLIVAFGPKMLLGINKENSQELVQFTFFFFVFFSFHFIHSKQITRPERFLLELFSRKLDPI